MRIANVLAFFLVATLVWGCQKEEMSAIPKITFIKQDSYQVPDSGIGVQDPILFTFNFQDGDSDIGPIGEQAPLMNNIHFVDSRSEEITRYFFPRIPTDIVTSDGISGSFTVALNPTTLIARDDTTIHKFTDTLRFKVFVIDGQQNVSNEVLTDSIVIVK